MALTSMAALVLVGCTPDAPTETTPPASTAASPQPDPEAELLDRAFGIAQEFTALVDAGFASGQLPTEELQTLATDDAIAEVQTDLDAFGAAQLQIDGTSSLDSPTFGEPEEDRPESGSVLLLTCLDTSEVVTTDSDGNVLSGDATRQPRVFSLDYNPDEIIVTNVGPPATGTELAGCGS